jgi:hypothetical protein
VNGHVIDHRPEAFDDHEGHGPGVPPATVLALTIYRRPSGTSRFPAVAVDGIEVPLGWGRNIICTTPGRHALLVSDPAWCEIGLIAEDLDLARGSTVELHYLAGAAGWGPAHLSTRPPRPPGPWARWTFAAAGVLAAAAAAWSAVSR